MTELKTLPEIIKGIKEKNVLLPHFQREYVWNKTQQKNLILSVLTDLPASSSLILKKQPADKFKCLKIGMRNEIIKEDGDGDCYYLLDGQQRFTTLFFAFHNIFNSDKKSLNENEFEKLDNKLKKRWYLHFQNNGDVVLNYDDLIFNKEKVNDYLPEDLDSFIEFENLNKTDLKSHQEDIEEIEKDCKINKKIPLFFILNHKTELKRILKKIFDDRIDEIKSERKYKDQLIEILKSKNFQNTDEKVAQFYNKKEAIIREIDKFLEYSGYKDEWVDGIFDHFHDVLKEYKIQPIVMEDRNKAVKTFEYINTGGTNLSSFDLLCAKIGSFDLRKKVIEKTKEEFLFFDSNFNENKSFRLFEDFGLVGGNEKNPSVEKKYAEYLSQVLNLLHFKEDRGKKPTDKEFSSSLLKSKYSLEELHPKFIEDNYKNAVNVIKNSVALLQVFCSHKDLKAITNYLSLVQIFTFFIYQDSKVKSSELKNLIGLFWLTLFTGRYDSHQNENSIEDARNMYKFIFQKDKAIQDKLKKLTNRVLNTDGFVTKKELTTEKCSNSLENNLFMFLRSSKNKFLDLDKEASELTIAHDIEIHHLIPLAKATKVGESTKEIRIKNEHLLNATMNKTPIKKETNKLIRDKSIDQYHNDLENYTTQFDYHIINASWAKFTYSEKEESKIQNLFEARYENFVRDLRTFLDSKLSS
ncbi:DUF262 domain-containing protein [Salegentibacter mishustinae]|uniref:DUF262 domain-containing protein n=1 Tax=Salegentibacter mishustinae TaxID=270918 RepID=UPI002491A9E4|nr:DUF262 domain-containing protein [Salegentibacter mishustinae]